MILRTYSPKFNSSLLVSKPGKKALQTFELDGAQDQSLAVMFRPHVSGCTSVAAKAAARLVSSWTYQDFALNIHRLCGSQELEGLKGETGVRLGASDVGMVGVVFTTPKGENDRRCYWTNTLRSTEQRGSNISI